MSAWREISGTQPVGPQRPGPPDPTVTVGPGTTRTIERRDGEVGRWQPGDVLRFHEVGEFRINRVLSGGMGVVLLADALIDRVLTTPYAIKTCQDWCLSTPGMAERFRREAEAWVRLDRHRNIIAAEHVEMLDGRPYIVLEYAPQGTLRHLMNRGPLPVELAASYVWQIASALIHARRRIRRFAHRDIKPENCLISVDGTLKLTDFGLVKSWVGYHGRLVDIPSGLASTMHSQAFRTAEGHHVIGTLPYMAPEQVVSFARADIRSDVYSMGVVLYELLTGRRPFVDEDPDVLISRLLAEEPVDPRELRAGIPDGLAAVALQWLDKDPAARRGPAGLRRLREWMGPGAFQEWDGFDLDSDADPIELWDADPNIVFVGPVELDGITSAGAELLSPLAKKGRSLRSLGRLGEAIDCFDEALGRDPWECAAWFEKGETLMRMGYPSDALPCYCAAISLRQTNLAHWQAKARALQMLGRKADADQCETQGARACAPRFGNGEREAPPSRHGRCVGAVTFMLFLLVLPIVALVLYPALGLKVALVLLVPSVCACSYLAVRRKCRSRITFGSSASASVSAKNRQEGPTGPGAKVAFTLNSVGFAESKERPLLPPRKHRDAVRAVAFSADSTRIVSAGSDHTIKVWNAQTGQETLRIATRSDVLAVAFRPDGKRLLAAGDELVVCDAISGEVLVRVPQSARGRMSSVCYAPDGRRMVSAGGTPVLWDADTGQELMSLGGGARGTNGHAPDWPYQVYALAFSPDGGRIVTGDASGELRLLDSRTGHEITRLSGPGNRVLSVAFRPDGRRIVAAAGNALVAWDAVSGKRTLTIHDGTEVRCAAFPPDGRWILAGGRHGLTVRDARADKCPLLLDFRHEEKDRTWCVVFSPDGTLMATGRMDGAITVWDTATGEELMSLPRLEESFSSVAGITNSSDV